MLKCPPGIVVRSSHSTVALLLTTLVTQGCTALSYGTFSAPVMPPGEATVVSSEGIHWYGRSKGDVIAIPEITLMVLPINEHVWFNVWGIIIPFLPLPGGSNDSQVYAKYSRKAPAFLVTLTIVPQVGTVTFDPGGVGLDLTPGENLRPIGYWGPEAGVHWGYKPNLNGCRGYEIAQANGAPIEPTSITQAPANITEETCFTLLFDRTPPATGQAFSLSIAGIGRNGQPITIPTVHFERDSAWNFALAGFY